jgi:hypothetical protein
MKHLIASTLALCCSVASASAAASEKRVELVDLLKQLMVNVGKAAPKDSYLEMKGIFGKLQKAEPSDLAPKGNETFPGDGANYFYIYQGRIDILANGKPLATDRMQEDASWQVWVAGPKAMVTNVWLRTEHAADAKAGPKYLRSKGIALEPISCSQLNGGNYTALYKASAPGKRPILLEVSASSGSGGTWYSYQATWFSIKASQLPTDAEIGLCEVIE